MSVIPTRTPQNNRNRDETIDSNSFIAITSQLGTAISCADEQKRILVSIRSRLSRQKGVHTIFIYVQKRAVPVFLGFRSVLGRGRKLNLIVVNLVDMYKVGAWKKYFQPLMSSITKLKL